MITHQTLILSVGCCTAHVLQYWYWRLRWLHRRNAINIRKGLHQLLIQVVFATCILANIVTFLLIHKFYL